MFRHDFEQCYSISTISLYLINNGEFLQLYMDFSYKPVS
jgi:hypothetical protein